MATPAVEPTTTAAGVDEKTLLSTTAPTGASSSSAPTGPVYKPAPHPLLSCHPDPAPPLTGDHESKYNELLSLIKAMETLPKTTDKKAESAPLSDEEKMWLTRECLLRYLRATKWHVPQALKRLQSTLIWRREYGTSGFTAEYISPENATGKQVLYGFDNAARPCLYLRPNKQNTKPSPRQIQHLVYFLERCIDVMPPGQETLALLVDFKESSASTNPSLSISKQVLDILQNHYPERLGRALVTHLPWYVTTFFKLISPFIDPVTKTKLRFNEPLTDHVPAAQLMKQSGGDVDFQYDHDVYWPELERWTEQCRKEHRERWERGGKLIGESEVYIKGGDEKSVGAKEVGVDQVDGLVEGVKNLETADAAAKEAEAPAPVVQPAVAEPKKE